MSIILEAVNVELLRDKVTLITGTSRGIGKKIAEVFASMGAIVYANACEEGSIDEYAKELEDKYNTTVVPVYFDVTDTAAAKKTIMRINKEQRRLDVLVNNAGIMKDDLIGMIQHSTIEKTFEVNVFAMIEMIQLATKLMFRQNSGSIINMSSIVGVNGNRGQMVYSATKGAVIALTKTAAKELAPKNIRVNAIAPGMIDTDMFNSIGSEHIAERVNLIGMKRLGLPEDVANACVYFASDLSAYVTGQILGVDGSAIV